MKRIFLSLAVLAIALQAAALSPDSYSDSDYSQASGSSYLQRYYNHSGKGSVSLISAGYTTYFVYPLPEGAKVMDYAFKEHLLTMEILELRAGLIGLSPLQFEMGFPFKKGDLSNPAGKSDATPKTMWFGYKPALKIYVPIGRWAALEVFGGVELDATKIWSMINKNYAYNEDNWFLNAFGGAGFYITAVPRLPIEVKAEYRHSLKGNDLLLPKGIYLSAQLHLAHPVKRGN